MTDTPTPNGPFVSTGNRRILEDGALALKAARDALLSIKDTAGDITLEPIVRDAIVSAAEEAASQVEATDFYIQYCPDCDIP